MHQSMALDIIILRFFNIFGVGQSKEYAGVIAKFIEKIRQDRPLEIFGTAANKRLCFNRGCGQVDS